jgi:pyruvate kinase
VVLTRRGVLANHVAMLRPRTSGFYAFTPTDRVCRQLALTRSVRSFKLAFASNIEETIERVSELLKREDLIRPGTPLVIVSDLLSDHFAANSILLHHA